MLFQQNLREGLTTLELSYCMCNVVLLQFPSPGIWKQVRNMPRDRELQLIGFSNKFCGDTKTDDDKFS